MRFLLLVCVFLVAGCSQEGGPRESEHKAEASNAEHKISQSLQHLLPPPASPAAPVINVYTAKHAGDESHCTKPKDWKEWGAFAWCRSLEWIDAERVIAIWTVVLGIATGILGVATVKLWRATDRLVGGAEKTAERQLRAYVHLKTFDVENVASPFNTDIWPTIVGIWENTGGTPTRKMRAAVNFAAFPGDIPENFDFPDDPELKPFHAIIGPRQTSEMWGQTLKADLLKQVAAKKLNLYVWGWAEYDDVFEGTTRHRTEFCTKVAVDGFAGQPNSFYRYRTHQRHNAADGDCVKKPQT